MEPQFKAASLALLCAAFLSGQIHVNETANLAEEKTTDSIVLAPPENVPAGSQPSLERIRDKAGKILAAQARVASPEAGDGQLKVDFSNLFFWGEAYLPVTFTAAGKTPVTATYRLWRGVQVNSKTVDVPHNAPGQIWISNPGNQPIEARWRVLSGTDSLCGLDQQGELRKDCNDISKLPEVRIPASGSVAITVYLPTWWRDPSQVFGGVNPREAQLNLYFGRDAQSQPLAADLKLVIQSSLLDAMTAWVPPVLRNLFYVLLWITVGANLLMVAQVMIPNFRRSLQIESKVEELRERLRAINSGVGSRLYTRCQQEIIRVTEGLGIREADAKLVGSLQIKGMKIPIPRLRAVWSRIKATVNRLALSGNTGELTRLESLLPKLESRLALTERFSDVLTAFLSSDTLAAAPSSVFDREEELRTLREILSRQLLTDAEDAGARAILARLDGANISIADFTTDLNSRLEALRRQLAIPVFQSRAAKYIGGINGCAEILAEKPDAAPKNGWSVDELIFHDLIAVKLRIIVFAIEIECLLKKKPELDAWIQEMLQSSDPIVIARIYGSLKQVSEGISQEDIRVALKAELWDTLFEPLNVRTQDVVQFTFSFREKALNRSTARETFQCYWKITPEDEPEEVSWEEGWSMQHIPLRSRFSVEPDIYDASGNQADIRKDSASSKGVARINVVRATGLSKRAIRGVIDAVITALVPVVTVAVTQVQNGGSITVDKLILLGFTSQAIRAAIIPESIRPEAAAKNTMTETTPAQKPPLTPQASVTPPTVDPDPKAQGTVVNTAVNADTGGKKQSGGDSTPANPESATPGV